MNKKDLIDKLNSLPTAERRHRDETAEFVLRNTETFPFLLEAVFSGQGRLSVKAAWVTELVCVKELRLIFPYLDFFSENMRNISNESALRPLMKVISFITAAYYRQKNQEIKRNLSQNTRKQLIEVCFDCLIGDHKIGSKVFAMDGLYDLGGEFSWIHPELRQILTQNMSQGSQGYKAHAKMILDKLK